MPNSAQQRTVWWTKITRDVVFITAGLLGVFHEIVFSNGDRPAILAACLVMMGLSPVFRADERRRERLRDQEGIE